MKRTRSRNIETLHATKEQMAHAIERAEIVVQNSAPWKGAKKNKNSNAPLFYSGKEKITILPNEYDLFFELLNKFITDANQNREHVLENLPDIPTDYFNDERINLATCATNLNVYMLHCLEKLRKYKNDKFVVDIINFDSTHGFNGEHYYVVELELNKKLT